MGDHEFAMLFASLHAYQANLIDTSQGCRAGNTDEPRRPARAEFHGDHLLVRLQGSAQYTRPLDNPALKTLGDRISYYSSILRQAANIGCSRLHPQEIDDVTLCPRTLIAREGFDDLFVAQVESRADRHQCLLALVQSAKDCPVHQREAEKVCLRRRVRSLAFLRAKNNAKKRPLERTAGLDFLTICG